MSDLMHLGYYTRELKKVLPEHYFEPLPRRALWMIPHLAVAIGGMYAVITTSWHGLIKFGIALLIGHAFACLGFLAHEILHGSVVRNPFLRNLLGMICFLPLNVGPKLWRKWHNVEHHGHTQHDDDDPDAMGTLEDYRERPALQVLYRIAPVLRSFLTFASFSFWFSFHSFLMWLRFMPEFKSRRERIVVALQFLGPVAFWIGFMIWVGPVNALYAYIIPVLTANFIVMSYIATNHLLNPLTHVNDPLANSLTVTTHPILDILHSNFSHHTEHHVFPAMNPAYAPALKRELKKRWPDRYCEMRHIDALLALWRTPRLYRDAGPHANQLIDPQRELVYPTVGHGLEPGPVTPTPLGSGEPASTAARPAAAPGRRTTGSEA